MCSVRIFFLFVVIVYLIDISWIIVWDCYLEIKNRVEVIGEREWCEISKDFGKRGC